LLKLTNFAVWFSPHFLFELGCKPLYINKLHKVNKKNMKSIAASELVLNTDGSVYHLHLKPENIADNIILVGDQDRVATISKLFDTIEFQIQSREFVTHTGTYKGKRITALSTGIGTDNIDIVLNELDALVNIDLDTKIPKTTHKKLNFVRIGTSGAFQPDIPVETPVVSQKVIGIDGLLNFYADRDKVTNAPIENYFIEHSQWSPILAKPYCVDSSELLLNRVGAGMKQGITVSAPGFFGPQGRVLRLPILDKDMNSRMETFDYQGLKITNFEMECSAIYGLSKLLGHEALTVCLFIANRDRGEFSSNYKVPMLKLIETVLDRI